MRLLRKLLIRLAAIACGLLLAFLLLELGLRAAGAPPIQRNSMRAFHDSDARLGWVGAPDYRARFVRGEFDVIVRSGVDGFRSPDPGAPLAADDAPEVLFLGDSFTWGFGVPQGAVYTDVLQRELGARARVANRGVNGYSSGQQLILLREHLIGAAPEVVVVAFYFNDLFENGDSWAERRPWLHLAGNELAVRNQPVARALAGPANGWTRRSRSLSLLGFVASRVKQATGGEPVFAPGEMFPLDRESLASVWALQSAILASMRDACAEAGLELCVMYVAPFFDLVPVGLLGEYEALAEARFGDELEARCAALGLPFLDSRAAFRSLPRSDVELGLRGQPYWYGHDDHWSPAGHELVGTWLAGELASRWPERYGK